MNRQFPGRYFHPPASCAFVAYLHIVVIETYIPQFKRGVFGNLLAVKHLWLQKVIGFGATHVAAIRAIRFGFFSPSMADAC
jgi:hypothetical protein